MGLYRKKDRGKLSKFWWCSFTVNGRQIRLSTEVELAEGKKVAKDKARELEDEWKKRYPSETPTSVAPATPVPRIPKAPRFELCVESYLEAKLAEGKKIASYDAFQDPKGEPALWAKEFAGRPLFTITEEEIETTLRRWALERSWKPATRNNRLNQLSGFLSYAVGRGWIDRHPTEKGRIPKLKEDNEREGWLSLEGLAAVCKKAIEKGHGYLVPIVVFEAKAGMRLGEVTELRCRDFVELDGGRSYLMVRETKNGRPIRFPLAGETRAFVRRRVVAAKPEDYLFPGPNGGCARSSIRRHLQEAVVGAGFEWGRTRTGITFHSLRRTMASLARNDGMSVEQIQKLGNWKDRRMVERYAMFADETLELAAARLDGVSSELSRFITQRDVGTLRPVVVKLLTSGRSEG